MFLSEKAFIDLLRGNLSIPDDKIFTGNRYRPIDVTPCVTVNQASEVQVLSQQMPGPEEVIRLEYDVQVWINIWCNTEEQRTNLIDEAETRIFQALANHYTTCARYCDGECDFLEDECATLNITNGRTVKNQCPYPHTYEYCSWFKKNQIIKRTFGINGKQDMDELNLSEPVLRTIIKVDMTYYKIHTIGGRPIERLIVDDGLLESQVKNNESEIFMSNAKIPGVYYRESIEREYFKLSEILGGHFYFVSDIIYEDGNLKYVPQPIVEVHCLKDLSGAVKNLEYTSEKDIQFDRFESDSAQSVLGKSEVESLNGLLVGLEYENGVIGYAQIITQ